MNVLIKYGISESLWVAMLFGYLLTINLAHASDEPKQDTYSMATGKAAGQDNHPIKAHSLNWFDESRKRLIPVEIVTQEKSNEKAYGQALPVVIINHGYGVKNVEYSFLANALATQGYLVASIQHDLEGDVPLAKTGSIFERRKPLWDRGAENITFVLKALKAKYPGSDASRVILVGHSNGGDISMLFAEQHPDLVSKVISLDSLRYPFPRNSVPILSLRANDTKADQGILPESGAVLIDLKEAKHIDMCDRGPDKVKKEILKLIENFLVHAKK